jgi:glucose/arabinose dehydrogenase
MTAIAGTQVAYMDNTPELLAPADGAQLAHPGSVVLEWAWERGLVGDEAYDVRVWRAGQPPNGITWTYETRFSLAQWLTQQPPGEFFWTVAVVGGDNGVLDRTVTNPSTPFRFTVADNRLPTATPSATATLTPTPAATMTPTPIDTALPLSLNPIPDHVVEVPDGFDHALYVHAWEIENPTAIDFGPDGLLYVLGLDGRLFKYADEDGDGSADVRLPVFLDEQERLSHAVGLAWHDGTLYVSDSGKISTLTDEDGDGVLDTVTPLIEGFVSLEYWGHSNNGIAFGQDGRLYVGIGSATDHGPILYPNREAVIMRMNPDGSDLEVFASGFRNPYDLVFTPAGDLFAADNNADRFDATLRFLPPEELNHVVEGGFYGFPDIHGAPPPGSDSLAPTTLFYPSVGSAGMAYYGHNHFPPPFREGIFVAQSGTRSSELRLARRIQNGFAVVFVPLVRAEDGRYEGDWIPFARFNQNLDETDDFRVLRPVDAAVGEDGALFIAEHTRSLIYRVVYRGGETRAAAPTATPATVAERDLLALGETLFVNGANRAQACSVCHQLGDEDEAALGPQLRGRASALANRVEGLSAAEYVRQSILNPAAYLVEGYDNVMYPLYADQLSPDQVDALVAYVLAVAAE